MAGSLGEEVYPVSITTEPLRVRASAPATAVGEGSLPPPLSHEARRDRTMCGRVAAAEGSAALDGSGLEGGSRRCFFGGWRRSVHVVGGLRLRQPPQRGMFALSL